MADTDVSKERERSSDSPNKQGLFARIGLFIRQVVAELKKVIWPTRNELVAYTTVVIVFVLFMAALVAVLDYVFTRGVLFVFG